MRAEDDAYEEYAQDYADVNGIDLEEAKESDDFNALWEMRNESNEAMALLLEACLDIDFEDALAWVEDRDS